MPGEDGWIRESRQGSGIGGKLNIGSGRGIRVGDYKKNLQYRAQLSFHLPSLPDGARVSVAYLELNRKSSFEVGTPAALGELGIDASVGSFSGLPVLELADFVATADLVTHAAAAGAAAKTNNPHAAIAALRNFFMSISPFWPLTEHR